MSIRYHPLALLLLVTGGFTPPHSQESAPDRARLDIVETGAKGYRIADLELRDANFEINDIG